MGDVPSRIGGPCEMKRFTAYLVALTVYTAAVSGVTYFLTRKFTQAGGISIVRETSTEHKILIPNVEALPEARQQEVFKECFYSPIEIEGIIKANVFHVRAANKCQVAEKDFYLKAEAGTSGNWKFYAGFAGGALLTAGVGYGAYKLFH